MTVSNTQSDSRVGMQSAKSEFRIRTASTKVTDAEFQELERYANARGQSMSEWIRNVLLTQARYSKETDIAQHAFTELVGVQLMLMNALAPLLRGDHLTQDQLESLWKHVQATKTRKAQELLSKRTNVEEK